MEMLIALKDSIESDARMDAKQKKAWVDFLVLARKDFYNRWVKEDVHRALFASFETEAQQLLEKYRRGRGSLDHREVTDPITGESRAPDERFLRSVEDKIKISDSGKLSFRQEVVRKAMVAYKSGEKFTLDSHARLHEAIEQYLCRTPGCPAAGDVVPVLTRKRARRSPQSRSDSCGNTVTTITAPKRRSTT